MSLPKPCKGLYKCSGCKTAYLKHEIDPDSALCSKCMELKQVSDKIERNPKDTRGFQSTLCGLTAVLLKDWDGKTITLDMINKVCKLADTFNKLEDKHQQSEDLEEMNELVRSFTSRLEPDNPVAIRLKQITTKKGQ